MMTVPNAPSTRHPLCPGHPLSTRHPRARPGDRVSAVPCPAPGTSPVMTGGRNRAVPLVVLLLGTALALGACGKKAPPQPPGPPDQVTWPHHYPTPPGSQATKP